MAKPLGLVKFIRVINYSGLFSGLFHLAFNSVLCSFDLQFIVAQSYYLPFLSDSS